ncbi:terminase gpA endonuclease subunit [Mesorhizobium sp.]|uniref:phage terminase large subunit family protein n=1 Tax=Mesorhizobium sp. TaxID=1871066 RepID=UPI0025DCECF1|nr:terminase gpA endonuclease subunit [Mesorhizobium sp.]
MRSEAVQRLFGAIAKGLRPPETLSYSQWAAKHFRLSATSSAAPGRFRPWKFQRGILDAMGDPLIERVSVIKSARTGYTVSLIATIGAYAVNDPCPIILLMPTDDDARGIAVDELDPAFRDTPALRDVMRVGRFDGRNTLTQRMLLGGGSLKILSALAPRNLRRHTAKVLLCDEVDGMKVTSEGDPIKLAEKRTTSFADRKIIIGSTPTDEATSIVIKRYEESDKRIFEIPCVHCETPFELLWEHLDWKAGQPETVVCICPHCGTEIEERFKPQMVEAGEWRATAPQVKGHAGFRLNALISQFANASWPKLVEEFEKARKAGPSDMQVFYNTVLGKVWSTAINYVNENQLLARCENFGIEWDHNKSEWRQDIPEDVAYITAGVDVQPDRLEVVLIGWSRNHRYILGHMIIRGSALLQTTWDELDALLMTVWKHPLGGEIGIEAGCVDSGDGNMTQRVYDYCEKTQGRKIVAIKGDDGPRPVLKASATKRRNRTATLYIVGVEQVKTDILVSLPLEPSEAQSFRFGNSLTEDYFVQLTAERRELKYNKQSGRPEIVFVRIGKRKAEGLDCTVYGIAAKQLCRFDFDTRYADLRGKPIPRPSLRDSVKRLHG